MSMESAIKSEVSQCIEAIDRVVKERFQRSMRIVSDFRKRLHDNPTAASLKADVEEYHRELTTPEERAHLEDPLATKGLVKTIHEGYREHHPDKPDVPGGPTAQQMLEEELLKAQERVPDKPDPWADRKRGMRCERCMWFVLKKGETGRCRRNAPTITGYPIVMINDWCGEFRLDEHADSV